MASVVVKGSLAGWWRAVATHEAGRRW
jgi:hypothetical protein